MGLLQHVQHFTKFSLLACCALNSMTSMSNMIFVKQRKFYLAGDADHGLSLHGQCFSHTPHKNIQWCKIWTSWRPGYWSTSSNPSIRKPRIQSMSNLTAEVGFGPSCWKTIAVSFSLPMSYICYTGLKLSKPYDTLDLLLNGCHDTDCHKQSSVHMHSRQGTKTLWPGEHFTTNPMIILKLNEILNFRKFIFDSLAHYKGYGRKWS